MRRLVRDERAVAATEFALLVPILIIILVAVIELSNFAMQSRRAHQAVVLAADFLSRDGDNSLSISERQIVEDIWMIVNPTAHLATTPRDDIWANGYSRALSSVTFEKAIDCHLSDCPLLPNVQWSFLFQDIIRNPVFTHCDLDVVSNDTALDGTNIRQGVVGNAPVVIVDFTYPYIPLFQGWLFPTLELHVNAVRKTRNAVPLGKQLDQWVTQC
ncbi:MAG: TadE/TadG family type IV pilus assembly protein [Burkholderiales bacterium]